MNNTKPKLIKVAYIGLETIRKETNKKRTVTKYNK